MLNNASRYIMGIFICACIIFAIIAIPIATYASKERVYGVEITDKERIVKSESSYYLVFTDKGVYQNTDSLWYFKFDSSDVQNEMVVGSVCDMTVYWYRVPFLSWYQNILEVNCKEPTDE